MLRDYILTVILLLPGAIPTRAFADEVAQTGDAFFAGNVVEFSAGKITVTRIVRGQTESRSFKVTPQTKMDGKPQKNVRVTVGYVSDDSGDTATMVVVRPPVPAPPQKNKK